MTSRNCTNCDATNLQDGSQWWNLNGYFGVTGYFCPACYELVSHDADRQPRHPEAYEAIKKEQTK